MSAEDRVQAALGCVVILVHVAFWSCVIAAGLTLWSAL
jgi:hypothetical protein